MWTFEEAQKLIMTMQPFAKEHGYHIALGGGVLNKLSSTKDLDMYFLPLDNGLKLKNVELIMWLSSLFGPGQMIEPGMYDNIDKAKPGIFGQVNLLNPPPNDPEYVNYKSKSSAYTHKIMFHLDKKRIDVFII